MHETLTFDGTFCQLWKWWNDKILKSNYEKKIWFSRVDIEVFQVHLNVDTLQQSARIFDCVCVCVPGWQYITPHRWAWMRFDCKNSAFKPQIIYSRCVVVCRQRSQNVSSVCHRHKWKCLTIKLRLYKYALKFSELTINWWLCCGERRVQGVSERVDCSLPLRMSKKICWII